jgi:hypothetical protein
VGPPIAVVLNRHKPLLKIFATLTRLIKSEKDYELNYTVRCVSHFSSVQKTT